MLMDSNYRVITSQQVNANLCNCGNFCYDSQTLLLKILIIHYKSVHTDRFLKSVGLTLSCKTLFRDFVFQHTIIHI